MKNSLEEKLRELEKFPDDQLDAGYEVSLDLYYEWPKLLAALRKCREQRDHWIDCEGDAQTERGLVEEYDAELLRLLNGEKYACNEQVHAEHAAQVNQEELSELRVAYEDLLFRHDTAIEHLAIATEALESLSNKVDSELLLDEALATGWDNLRKVVIEAREALEKINSEEK